ncbi:MAG: transcription antitermination protein NusB [Tenuifilum sp.]|jgi:N utilization substance protein B|uniref:transcription antitermination factor NusB n=1 Tax=Tenuifilum sp. TaxID=2760880 RepID=UPI0024AC81BC|nr:transcription antitermination factor NusB [Tenuifilum sp.]MDI3528173.1 transcription antitermination protein NusB [Tenuifilum sp.]
MINRRLIRIKALQVLFAYYRNGGDSLINLEKELFHSIDKSYHLYILLLLLPETLVELAQNKIDLAKQKLRPTPEELNPNLRFVQNRAAAALANDDKLHERAQENRLNWLNQSEITKSLFNQFIASDFYASYMNADECSFADDKAVFVQFFNKILNVNDDFDSFLEEQSIYWNDDLEFVSSMAVKTIKKIDESSSSVNVMDPFRSDDDIDFAKRLLRKTVLNHKENLELIDQFTQNWELDRIAAMDILIMELALTEIMEFPTIPVKVSMNEYIDIAKFYSTEQSNVFINGVLDKIIAHLREKGAIVKQGRGLIGENNESISSESLNAFDDEEDN